MTTETTIDIPYLLRSLEQALRAGFSLRQAVGRVSGEIGGLDDLAADLSAGADLVESIAFWADRRPEPAASLLVGVVRLQIEDGGNLADKLGLLHRILDRT